MTSWRQQLIDIGHNKLLYIDDCLWNLYLLSEDREVREFLGMYGYDDKFICHSDPSEF